MTAVDPAAMSGLELLRLAGTLPESERPPGIGSLLGMEIDEVEEGRVVFSLRPRPEFANPLGTVHGGIPSTLLDSAMACAVHTTLPAGAGYTSLELKVNFVRTIRLDEELLLGEGTVIHVGGRTATAEGRVTDATGRLLAHGTTTCMLFR
ncbi:PaaI family thioesterase [Amycolatopsis cihanbeyliensis]|uniref:Uncharacterized protein (TIGR00369 family) n=1 Tax=Amycolatopsis cihanbeyliensis TaxID=1128664 RepID=A0A542DN03_AMYCI|nr:PaaI family thioesterase [Amycolatopsis cihanbeyliensis]TQJ04344.1 uncharacterized protein (TIGR00369 family) [Amycolatopsis cihanbeyliensis]